MKNTFLLFALLLVPTVFVAQIGVGTTTVDSSAKLQVDATNKGFLQPRVTLTGTSDTSTIATPATGLMVFNTATAGTGSTAVTPGIYYYTGSAWQRVADETPVVSSPQASTTRIDGVLGTEFVGGAEYISPGPGSTKYFGANITLPPGKWEVVLNLYYNILEFNGMGMVITGVETTYWLTDSATPTNMDYSIPTIPSNITTDVLMTGGGSFSEVGSVGGLGTYHNGSFFINNTGETDKTYYLFFHEAGYTNFENENGQEPVYNKLGGTACKGNRFYAVQLN